MSMQVLKPHVFAPEEVETIVAALEFMNETTVNFGALEIMELACNDASCAPPPHGTGGSKKTSGGGAGAGAAEKPKKKLSAAQRRKAAAVAEAEATDVMADGWADSRNNGPSISQGLSPKGDYIGKEEDAKDRRILLVRALLEGKKQGKNGLLLEDYMDEDGNITISEKDLAKANASLEKLGLPYQTMVDNFVAAGLTSDMATVATAKMWYQEENVWISEQAAVGGIANTQVTAVASAMSVNKQWDGVENSNKVVAERMIGEFLKDNKVLTVTQEISDEYADFSRDSASGGGKFGPKTIEPGDYPMDQLSSGAAARLMGSGYGMGGQYYTEGMYKALVAARGEVAPNDLMLGEKQRSFSNSLASPNLDYNSTNDFWMVRAAAQDQKLNVSIPGNTKNIAGMDKNFGITLQKKGTWEGQMTVREWEQVTGQQPNSFIGSGARFASMTRAAREARARLSNPSEPGNTPERAAQFESMNTLQHQAVIWVSEQNNE